MGLFKDVKKPVIRQAARGSGDISPLRPRFVPKAPPCADGCPAGVDVRGWLTTIAEAEAYGQSAREAWERAWQIVVEGNPFPATLGRICPHPCERACHRAARDGAVAINALERTLGDVAIASGFVLPVAPQVERRGRIAVVGAGPAGLSCAYYLRRRGHEVVVYEARGMAGGRLRDGIRTGRVADRVVDAEIRRVLATGVELRCDSVVAEDAAGLEQEYDAVCLATGRAPANPGDPGTTCTSVRPRVFATGDRVKAGLVGAALAGGRRAADVIREAVEGVTAEHRESQPPIAALRLKLDWYPQADRGEWTSAVATDVVDLDADASAQGLVVAEARRCLSCGRCMDCERCWMFCTSNCFEKLPKGQHYRVNTDTCNGCRKCADECPCGYIEMT